MRTGELTFINAVTEGALVAAPPVDEVHEGAHVGLASVTAEWASLAVVYNVQGSLQELGGGADGGGCHVTSTAAGKHLENHASPNMCTVLVHFITE